MTKTKIVLDTDVIVHFAKGGMLSVLPCIFKNYDHIVLDKVYAEIWEPFKNQFDNQICYLKNIQVITYNPTKEEQKEYARLLTKIDPGESACLAYCRFNHEVIGSSNLKDIKEYCEKHQITYLTTLDFLYHAIKQHLITVKDANSFIKEVINQGSNLPNVDMSTFICKVSL